MKNKPFIIIQGGKSAFVVAVVQLPNRTPYDLTSVSEITTCFTKDDGTELMLSLTGSGITVFGNPVLGQIQIALTAAQTAELIPVQLATLEIAITFPSNDPIKTQIINAYDVLASVC